MKIYNKISIILAILCFAFSVNAQQRANDQRTNETKIVDIAMLLPAKDADMQNELMQELIRLDNVVPNLAPKLLPPGQGDDSQVRAAISGLAFYASRGNNTADKKKVADWICKALPTVQSDEVKDFLLIQLQYVAGDESIGTVSPYLENARLADAAARVLVRIGSDSAGKALNNALGKAGSSQRLTFIQALGDMRFKPALENITKAVGTQELKKAALYSLAQIAAPESGKILAEAAAQAGYKYESGDALGSYMLFLKNSLPTQANTVAKSAQQMLKVVSETSQPAAKSAALNLYASAAGEKALPEILSALDSKDETYRAAALSAAANLQSPKVTDALLKKAGKATGPLKAEIVNFFGTANNKAALPFVSGALKDNNPDVVAAAITAVGKLNGEHAINPIIDAMKNATQSSVADAGKNALSSIKSDNLSAVIANAVPQASSSAKVALMEVLASRRAIPQAETVFSQTTSNDANVRLTAIKALSSVVTAKDVSRTAQLLNNASNKDEIAALQKALLSAVSSESQDRQTDLVIDQAMSSNNPASYGNVLAMIGGKKALDIVMNQGFYSNDENLKEAAFEALTKWKDDVAVYTLYKIAADNPSGAYFNKALTAYLTKAESSKNTPEQKLLLLRNALDIAQTPDQKTAIIKQIGNTGTFLGMITAKKYSDDPNENVKNAAAQAINKIVSAHPEYTAKDGFVPIFNGNDLTGWKGLVENPIARSKMKPAELAQKQVKADEVMRRDWKVENGMLVYEGTGYDNLCTTKMYGDIEMYVDWKIAPKGDAGIYLRGSPQVQIWDTSRTNVGAQVGSGGLYNNQKYLSKPLLVADNPINEWNSFHIIMEGDKVTVYLNGQLVTDNVILENFWDRSIPIFPEEAIELQAHDSRVEYRDLYIREIPRPEPYQVSEAEKKDGFVPLFNGMNLTGWIGNLKDYYAKDGKIICDPERGGHGNLYTDKEYSDFIMRFEFQLTPAANNGLGIRAPLEGDAAYVGMELQILDNDAEVYKDLHPYQYHGSVYGVIPAKRGYLKPLGEWNYQEVIAKGNRITITLNGTVILDGDIAEASKNFTETIDGNKHPGLSNKTGHIGFLGHGSWVAFRNLRIKELK